MTRRNPDEVHLSYPGSNPIARAAFAAVRPSLEWMVGMPELNRIYTEKVLPDGSDACPGRRFLEAFESGYLVSDEELGRIPTEGPLVVVANHP